MEKGENERNIVMLKIVFMVLGKLKAYNVKSAATFKVTAEIIFIYCKYYLTRFSAQPVQQKDVR